MTQGPGKTERSDPEPLNPYPVNPQFKAWFRPLRAVKGAKGLGLWGGFGVEVLEFLDFRRRAYVERIQVPLHTNSYLGYLVSSYLCSPLVVLRARRTT